MEFCGEKIKKMRQLKKWSQVQLAEQIAQTKYFRGFTHQRVAQLERSDDASYRVLLALCETFKCNPGVFFEK